MSQKKIFSQQKLDFCGYKRSTCFHDFELENQQYVSLAFIAQDRDGNIDLDKYIELWDEFIAQNYGGQIHKETSLKEQLEKHRDYRALPKNLYKTINKKETGTYLLLRTNKAVSEAIRPHVESLFGITKRKPFRIGLLQIVSIDAYETVYPLLEYLDVSGFKVIVPKK